MKPAWFVVLLAAFPLACWGQSEPADAVFQVDFTQPEMVPAHWTLTLHPDGTGHYRSERGSAPRSEPGQIEVPNVDRDVQVSPTFAAHAFDIAQRHKFFNQDCESHLKVAFQGNKQFTYTGADGHGSCTFNYSKDKDIQAFGDSLIAVSETILEGARLEKLMLHDRLGLDQEMSYLMEASGDGRAQQICSIRSILERLAADDAVLERVRKWARQLLARAET